MLVPYVDLFFGFENKFTLFQQAYAKQDLQAAKLKLLSQTKMIDATIELHTELNHSGDEIAGGRYIQTLLLCLPECVPSSGSPA